MALTEGGIFGKGVQPTSSWPAIRGDGALAWKKEMIALILASNEVGMEIGRTLPRSRAVAGAAIARFDPPAGFGSAAGGKEPRRSEADLSWRHRADSQRNDYHRGDGGIGGAPWRSAVRSFLVALHVLTIFPYPRGLTAMVDDLGRSMGHFSLNRGSPGQHPLADPPPAPTRLPLDLISMLLLALLAVLTGGLHWAGGYPGRSGRRRQTAREAGCRTG